MHLRAYKDAGDQLNAKLRGFCKDKGYFISYHDQYQCVVYFSVFSTPWSDSTLKVDEDTGFHISLENQHIDKYDEVLEFLKTITLGENDEAI
jgi:hypothetical protein